MGIFYRRSVGRKLQAARRGPYEQSNRAGGSFEQIKSCRGHKAPACTYFRMKSVFSDRS